MLNNKNEFAPIKKGEKHSHEYFLTHPEPKVAEVRELLSEVTVDFSKWSSEQLYHMFKHTYEQDTAVIKEQEDEIKRLKEEVAYFRNMLRRSKNAQTNDKLRTRNEELEGQLKWVRESFKEFLHALPR